VSTTRKVVLGLIAAFLLFVVVSSVRGNARGGDQAQCAIYDAQGLPLPQSCLEDQSWRAR
jgi:hypothetical protein